MLTPGNVQVWVATEPVSLLKSIDGLAAEVERRFAEDPARGHIFAFINRQQTAVKLLYWSNGGFVVTYKRLEKGRFSWPVARAGRVEVTAAQLAAVLDGIDLSRCRKIPAWNPK